LTDVVTEPDVEDVGRVTWTPDPRKAWPPLRLCVALGLAGAPHGPGYRFEPDGTGGGVLTEYSKTTMRWRVVATKLAHGA
jgi:hypothetical protein